MRQFFITGTDTDCGKTYVSCQLLDYCKRMGHSALGIKPIASGCFLRDGQWISEDALALEAHSAPFQVPYRSWRLKSPISPHLAAEEKGVTITLDDLMDSCAEAERANPDYLFIEGAGGLMAPLNSKDTWLDYLTKSHLPVIMVVGMRLGCLNHALLTDTVLASHQITCVGWIANVFDKDMLALSGNIETLKNKMKAPWLATITHQGDIQGDFLMRVLAGEGEHTPLTF